MDTVIQIANACIILIRAGAAFRVVFCIIRIGANQDEAATYKKRMRNVIIFYVLAELSWSLKDLVTQYFT